MAATALSYPRAADTGGVNYARAIFGFAVALVGAALVLVLYMRGQPQTVQVLEAARDLPPGAVLQPDDLLAQAEPLSDGLSGLVVHVADRAAVIGHPIGNGLLRGIPLARAQVLDAARGTWDQEAPAYLVALWQKVALVLARAYYDAGQHAAAAHLYAMLLDRDPLHGNAQEGRLLAAARSAQPGELDAAWARVRTAWDGEVPMEFDELHERLQRELAGARRAER